MYGSQAGLLGYVILGSNIARVLEFVKEPRDEIAPAVFLAVVGHSSRGCASSA